MPTADRIENLDWRFGSRHFGSFDVAPVLDAKYITPKLFEQTESFCLFSFGDHGKFARELLPTFLYGVVTLLRYQNKDYQINARDRARYLHISR